MNIKHFLFFLICWLFALSSCKKTGQGKVDVTPLNTLSATINGVNVNFNAALSAHISSEPGAYPNVISIYGTTGTGNNANIVITVSSMKTITSGTYISSDNPGTIAFSDIFYEIPDGTSQVIEPYIADSSGFYPTTVTITSISSMNVQGTFNGTLVYSLGGGTNQSIINGKFNVRIN